MNIMKWFLCLLFFAMVLTVHAQDSVQHSTLSMGMGVSALLNKDRFQSPYTYRGTNVAVNALYTNISAKGEHIIDLTYSGGSIQSVVSPKADNRLIFFSYDYLFNIKTIISRDKFKPSLGFGVHTLLSSTNFLSEVASPKNYLSGIAYLTLSGKIQYQITKRSAVEMQFALPVAGLVYRPTFDINGKTMTKTTFFGESTFVSAKLTYYYKLTTNLKLTAAWNYTYFAFDEPRPITLLQNSFVIGLTKKF